MIQIELSFEEVALLQQLLQASLVELRTEVTHTDRRDYRAGLKARETLLKRLLERLEALHPIDQPPD